MSAPTILLSAGEASSDMYAARLARDLRERTGARIFGMGGPRMAEAGVELIADNHEVAVVGIAEVLHKIPATRAPVPEAPVVPRSRLSGLPLVVLALVLAVLVAAVGWFVTRPDDTRPGGRGVGQPQGVVRVGEPVTAPPGAGVPW